jgi:hypothetical protein
MTRLEVKAYGITLGVALLAVAAVLGVQGFLDRLDRDAAAWSDYRKWISDSCVPGPGESSTLIHDGKKLHCTIYSQRGYGLTTKVVSSAVAEVPE